jgi:hypothetical protein
VLIRNAYTPAAHRQHEPMAERVDLPENERLLLKIGAFLKRMEMSESRFGRLARNDHKFMAKLREGVCPRPETVEAVESWMRRFEERG